MDDKVIARLNEFYNLETFQVSFYNTQYNLAIDEYDKKAFKKLIQIEQGHADFFAKLLQESGESFETIGTLFDFAGSLVGKTSEVTGQRNYYKLGAMLENKAIQHYQKFIKECSEKKYIQLKNTLMEYLLDEEFHMLWLQDQAKNNSN
jgi:bacterioferritin